MKWIEMIKIQAASGQATILNDELTTLVQTMQRHSDCQGLTKIDFCQHGAILECFALHLWWETVSPERQSKATNLSSSSWLIRVKTRLSTIIGEEAPP